MQHSGWPAAVAHRIGMGGAVDFTVTKVGQTLHVPCEANGGHLVDFEISGRMPPDFVAKKMMQKGWSMGSRLLCPDHSRRPKKTPTPQQEKPMADATSINTVTGQITNDSTPPKASAAAGKAKRLVYMALEDYYDEPGKCYKPGHSDATIAKSCGGISEAAVKAIREESYGPLGEPVDIAEWKEGLKACREAISKSGDDLRNEVRKLEMRLSGLIKRNGWGE